MKKSGTAIMLFVIVIGWQISAVVLSNDVLMPYPTDVVNRMISQCTSQDFYTIISFTLWRSLSGLLLAFVSAIIIVFLSFYNSFIKGVFFPLLLMMKSIPNISYIIIVLVWFGSEKSVTIIIFLILFPMIYTNLYAGLLSMDPILKDVLSIYPETKIKTIKKVYIPMLRPYIQASILSGLGMAFKVGVMAEIIGQVQIGIGRQLNINRLNLDMTGIFAWTAWIIFLIILLEGIQRIIQLYINQKELN